MSDSETQWTVAYPAPLSMGSSRQKYWTGFPHSPSGDLPDPGTEPASLLSPALAGGFFTTSATWKVLIWIYRVGYLCERNLRIGHLICVTI